MRKEPTGAVLLALIAFVLPSHAAAQREFGHFDRLAVVQRFLDEVYPEAKNVHGLILSRSETFHLVEPENFGRGGLQIDIVPCRPGSGVPAMGQKMAIPHCTGLFLPSFSEFLTISVGYSSKVPFTAFRVKGTFVDGKSQAVKEEIWDHVEWTREEWTQAVLRARPRFGPAQKEEFIRSIPQRTIKAVRDFADCRLDLSTARFVVDRLGNKPDYMQVYVQWIITGKLKHKVLSSDGCQATFEPFEGKLLSIN